MTPTTAFVSRSLRSRITWSVEACRLTPTADHGEHSETRANELEGNRRIGLPLWFTPPDREASARWRGARGRAHKPGARSALGADEHACDAARILRPPRTVNRKYVPPGPSGSRPLSGEVRARRGERPSPSAGHR